MMLLIETNGSLGALKRVDEIQEKHGKDAARIWLHFGLKATSPEKLAELTGMAPRAAAAAHKRQLDSLFHVAEHTDISVLVQVLDRYSDPAEVAALSRALDLKRPGLGDDVNVEWFNPSYKANKLYTPKRHRS